MSDARANESVQETEVERLRRENEQWAKWGVVEVAVRNPQVAEYCKHWEGRVEKAEADVSGLRKRLLTAEKERDLAIKQLTPVMEALDSVSDKLEAAEAQLTAILEENHRLAKELLERETQRNLAREARENWRQRAEAAEGKLGKMREALRELLFVTTQLHWGPEQRKAFSGTITLAEAALSE